MIIEREVFELAQLIHHANWNHEPEFLNVPCADGSRRPAQFRRLTLGDLTQVVEDRTRRAVKILERWRTSRSPHAFRAAAHAVAQANRYALRQQCHDIFDKVHELYKPFTIYEEVYEDEVDAQ